VKKKPIKGFPEYQIAEDGTVYRNAAEGGPKELRPYSRDGVPSLKMWKGVRNFEWKTIADLMNETWGEKKETRNEKIRRFSKEGMSKPEIAQKFGLSRQAVYKVLGDS